jgi:hypothetical protein
MGGDRLAVLKVNNQAAMGVAGAANDVFADGIQGAPPLDPG